MAHFELTFNVPATPLEVFQSILDVSTWPTFRGFGPIPGIVEARCASEDVATLGTRIDVRNTDGSTHTETVVEFDPGRRIGIEMQVTKPAAYVLGGILETLDFEPKAGGTQVRRRFEVWPRSWLVAPAAWVLTQVFLKRAVMRHNLVLANGGGISSAGRMRSPADSA